MISFESDYTNGAHPAILKRFLDTNDELLSTYGNDIYSDSAKAKIKDACKCPEAGAIEYTGHKVLTIGEEKV